MQRVEPAVLDEVGSPHTVDYQHHIVAYENGGDEQIGVGIEPPYGLGKKTARFHVEFHSHAVGGDERYFRA